MDESGTYLSFSINGHDQVTSGPLFPRLPFIGIECSKVWLSSLFPSRFSLNPDAPSYSKKKKKMGATLIAQITKSDELVSMRELSVPQFYVLFFRLRDNFSKDILLQSSLFTPPATATGKMSEQDSADRECVICMSEEADEILPCTHAFCSACIKKWSLSSRECPICRRECREDQDAWVLTDTPSTTEVS